MTILASLLPGVRAIRAPLAAGLVLLLAIWLAVEPSLPVAAEATGVYKSLTRLGELDQSFGAVALVALTAYLVGSMYVVIAGVAMRWVVTRWPKLQVVGPDGRLGTAFVRPRHAESETERDLQQTVQLLTGLLPSRAETEHLARHIADAVEPRLREFLRTTEASNAEHATALDRAARFVAKRLLDEDWDSLPLSLIGTQPQLYAEVDRFRAETEFRAALAGPAAALIAVLAVRTDVGWWIALPTVVVELIVLGAFALASRDAIQRANSTLAGGIRASLVHPPSLDAQALDDITLQFALQPSDATTRHKSAALAAPHAKKDATERIS